MPDLNGHIDEVLETEAIIELWQLMLPARIDIEQLSAPAQRGFRAE